MTETKTLEALEKEFAEKLALYEVCDKWNAYYEARKKAGIATQDDDYAAMGNDSEKIGLSKYLCHLEEKIKAIKNEGQKNQMAKIKKECYAEMIQRASYLYETLGENFNEYMPGETTDYCEDDEMKDTIKIMDILFKWAYRDTGWGIAAKKYAGKSGAVVETADIPF